MLALVSVALLTGSVAATGARAQSATGTADATSATAAFTAKVVTQLKLTPQQQAALQAFETLTVDKSLQNSVDPDAFRAMSLPQKLDYMADRGELAVTKMRAGASAAHRFYDLLSLDQRKAFDALMFPPQGSLAPPTTESPTAAVFSNQLPSHTEPDWLVKPTDDEISRVYPREALRNHVAGAALLRCMVNIDGYLSDCTVNSETPKEAGFGNAALEITAYMRMKPAANYGIPVESQVDVPINFQF